MKFTLISCFLFFSISLLSQGISSSKEYAYSHYSGINIKERPPIWPGCSEGDIYKLRTCFDKNLSEHILTNFIIPYEVFEKVEDHLVTVHFVVKKNGKIYIRKINGGIPEIQELARRTILSIPQLKPGELGGKKKDALYTVPINY